MIMNNRIRKRTVGNENPGRFIAIASGKGGVGKSVITYNLARQLSKEATVLVIDGDFHMGNLHILANAAPKYGWIDVCSGKVALTEAIIGLENGPDLLGSTGIESGGKFPELHRLAESLAAIRKLLDQYDYILADTASGILPHSNLIFHSADEIVLVTTPELTSLSDTYALFKILITNKTGANLSLLVNRERREDEVAYIKDKFDAIARQFLNCTPAFFGWLPADPALVDTVARQVSVCDYAPDSPAGGGFARLAETILGRSAATNFALKPLSYSNHETDTKE